MEIRNYQDGDWVTISRLFYDTVHAVNAKDYSERQLCAWAPHAHCLNARRGDLSKQFTLIAEINGAVVGFGSIDRSGYLDLLFVHKNHQNRGIATALCNELEKNFSTVKTYSSVTAKPFFESRGYVAVKAQGVERGGVLLKNFVMQKENATPSISE